MDLHEQKKNNKMKFTPILVIIALLIGFFGGKYATTSQNTVLQAQGFDELQATYSKIQEKYLYGADNNELIEGAIQGMVSSLGDQYSQYLADEAGEQYVDSYHSNFYGIGATVSQKDDRFFVSELIKDMPAEKSGLKPDDEIVTVDQQNIAGLTFNELLGLIRGEKGTSVTVGIKRAQNDQIIEFKMERAEIPVHTVSSKQLDNNIGLIAISRFAEKTDVEFTEALAELQQAGELQGLIIDLRMNPGGLLNQTVEIANVLVPNGKKILDVVYKNEERKVSFVSKQKEAFDTPVVVLVNQYSASASEVLSAALKESAGASIVGVKTYGKGVVQTFQQFRSSGSVLVLTEAEWKTPNGNGIHKIGVEPTHVVELPEYASLSAVTAGVELKRNSFGDDVVALQKILLALGYSPSSDGLYDQATEQAVKQYEQDKNVEVDGIYNDELGTLLITDMRQLVQENDTQLQAAVKLLTEK